MKTPNRVPRKISQMRAKCGNVEEKYSLFSMVLSGQCYTGGLSVGYVLSATGGKSKASKQRTAGLNQHLLPPPIPVHESHHGINVQCPKIT